MSTMPTIPGAAGGAVTGQKNIGKPVLGNAGGLNQFSPNGGKIGPGGTASLPGVASASTGVAPNTSGVPYMPPQTATMNQTPAPVAVNTPGIQPIQAGAPVANNGNPVSNSSPQQQQQLQKQLVDIYGKGTGNALANLIGNLGSNDSSYLQAYKDAMAKTQSEGLSTIGTSLGNAGISANSSVSAIEKADYISGLSSQVGLQEQQLINQQTQDQIGLLQGLQNDSKAEVGTSWLDTLGQVADVGGTIAGDVLTGGLSSAVSGAARSILGGSAPKSIINSTPSQLPGAINSGYPGSMPASIPGTQGSLPGLDF